MSRGGEASLSDVVTTSSGVHGSTSSRRLYKTSSGPVHDVLTTSSRRRIFWRVAFGQPTVREKGWPDLHEWLKIESSNFLHGLAREVLLVL